MLGTTVMPIFLAYTQNSTQPQKFIFRIICYLSSLLAFLKINTSTQLKIREFILIPCVIKKRCYYGRGERNEMNRGLWNKKQRGASARKYTTAILNIWSKSIVQNPKIGQTTLFRCEVNNWKEPQLGGDHASITTWWYSISCAFEAI